MRKSNLVLIVLSCAWLFNAGCAHTLHVSVTTFADPSVRLVPPLRFTTIEAPSPNELLERELLADAAQDLIARGYIFDPHNPDLVLTLQYTQEGNYYTYYDPIAIGGAYYWRGGAVAVPPTVLGPWTELHYSRSVTVWIGDAHQAGVPGGVGPARNRVAWQGTVGSNSKDPDLRAVTIPMLNELLGEFPQRTAKAIRRDITVGNAPPPAPAPAGYAPSSPAPAGDVPPPAPSGGSAPAMPPQVAPANPPQ